MCCVAYTIGLVNGKLDKNATMNPAFFGITTKKTSLLYSYAEVGMSTPAKKDYANIGM